MIDGPGSASQSIIPHLWNDLPVHHSTLSESIGGAQGEPPMRRLLHAIRNYAGAHLAATLQPQASIRAGNEQCSCSGKHVFVVLFVV